MAWLSNVASAAWQRMVAPETTSAITAVMELMELLRGEVAAIGHRAFLVSFNTWQEHNDKRDFTNQPGSRVLCGDHPEDQLAVRRALRYMRFSSAAYGWPGLIAFSLAPKLSKDVLGGIRQAISIHARVPQSDIHFVCEESHMHLPNHYVAVDREHKEVVLCIRGTMHWRDILTDLVADTSALYGGIYSHKGMFFSARRIARRTWPVVSELLSKPEHAGYKLVVCGHSLGGGVAILSTLLLWRAQRPDLADSMDGSAKEAQERAEAAASAGAAEASEAATPSDAPDVRSLESVARTAPEGDDAQAVAARAAHAAAEELVQRAKDRGHSPPPLSEAATAAAGTVVGEASAHEDAAGGGAVGREDAAQPLLQRSDSRDSMSSAGSAGSEDSASSVDSADEHWEEAELRHALPGFPQHVPIECHAFGAPPVLFPLELVPPQVLDSIWCYVNAADIVCRLGKGAALEMVRKIGIIAREPGTLTEKALRLATARGPDTLGSKLVSYFRSPEELGEITVPDLTLPPEDRQPKLQLPGRIMLLGRRLHLRAPGEAMRAPVRWAEWAKTASMEQLEPSNSWLADHMPDQYERALVQVLVGMTGAAEPSPAEAATPAADFEASTGTEPEPDPFSSERRRDRDA